MKRQPNLKTGKGPDHTFSQRYTNSQSTWRDIEHHSQRHAWHQQGIVINHRSTLRRWQLSWERALPGKHKALDFVSALHELGVEVLFCILSTEEAEAGGSEVQLPSSTWWLWGQAGLHGGRDGRRAGRTGGQARLRREPFSIAGGNANSCSSVGNPGQFLKEVKSHLSPFYQAHSQNETLSTRKPVPI